MPAGAPGFRARLAWVLAAGVPWARRAISLLAVSRSWWPAGLHYSNGSGGMFGLGHGGRDLGAQVRGEWKWGPVTPTEKGVQAFLAGLARAWDCGCHSRAGILLTCQCEGGWRVLALAPPVASVSWSPVQPSDLLWCWCSPRGLGPQGRLEQRVLGSWGPSTLAHGSRGSGRENRESRCDLGLPGHPSVPIP